MRNILAPLLALMLLGCAQQPVVSVPPPPPLPLAVTNPPSATTEGALTKNLQDGWNETLQVLAESLQTWHDSAMKDLAESLDRARASPQRPGDAPSGR